MIEMSVSNKTTVVLIVDTFKAVEAAVLCRYVAWLWLYCVWQDNVVKWFGAERKWSLADLRRLFTLLFSINCDAVSSR